MAVTYYAGSAGRVQTGSNVAFAGVTSWKITKKVGELDNTNFESPVGANGVIYQEFMSDNLGSAEATLEGVIDHGTLKTEATLPIGTTITVDFLYDKTSNEGFTNVSCLVREFSPGVNYKEKQAFTANLRVLGVMPIA